MYKFINSADTYVDDMLAGYVRAHPEVVRAGRQGRTLVRRAGMRPGRVGLATGGGAGHLPLFLGYIGPGFVDTCAVGNVFEGPALGACIDAVKMADAGAGVLILFGNYGGDRMNFEMARKAVRSDLIETVLVNDDIASADTSERQKRRGVAGIIFAYKTAGAMAEAGAPLGDVADMARLTVSRTRTIGVGLKGCRLPSSTAPVFELPDGYIEMGIGIHGERGIRQTQLAGVDAVIDEMLSALLQDVPAASTGRVALLINGLGATPLEEQYIAFRRAAEILEMEGFEVVMPLVGSYVTALEMAGLSISLCFLDNEVEPWLAAKASCPFWKVA
ncbi:dihydroxyacetone kinase subunit DhaK [Neorhizobium sp. NCHU2750]|uniref:dihydroxyacetone kinase subunit DhaK n=1 Tax=Neorhizobium sp. NCHU2750 TaxID=1825976 RepID=UPI000E74D036|nr:dihydroxyacetone kinase [Neorhizobium sp. NCHU2750]